MSRALFSTSGSVAALTAPIAPAFRPPPRPLSTANPCSTRAHSKLIQTPATFSFSFTNLQLAYFCGRKECKHCCELHNDN